MSYLLNSVLLGCILSTFDAGSLTGPAWWRGVRVGVEESIRDIQSTKSGTYVLCYKKSFYYFALPWHVSDDGYVVRPKDDSNSYSAELGLIEELQKQGELPTPLPGYSLSNADYVFGYSLEIVVIGGILLLILQLRWEKKNPAKAAALQQPASANKHRKAAPKVSVEEANKRLSEQLDELNGQIPK